MSESKWSPEPWKADTHYGDEGGAFDGIRDARLNTVIGEYGPSEEDRDRIVACVNACAGIPTDALESGALGALITAAEHQRDTPPGAQPQLLAALRSLGRLK